MNGHARNSCPGQWLGHPTPARPRGGSHIAANVRHEWHLWRSDNLSETTRTGVQDNPDRQTPPFRGCLSGVLSTERQRRGSKALVAAHNRQG